MKVQPHSPNQEEIQEIMFSENKLLNSTKIDILDIQKQLTDIKNSFLKDQTKQSPYKTFLLEYELFCRRKSASTFSQFKEKIMNNFDLKALCSKDLLLLDYKMPILNYFAYFLDLDTLQFLFELFEKTPLEIYPDFLDRDVLEIALALKNRTMVQMIIIETTKSPPTIDCWMKLSSDTMNKLYEMEIDKLGSFIDSRAFSIKVDNNLSFSLPFFQTRSFITDKLPIDNEDIKDYLIKPAKSSNSITELTEFRFLDIKNYAKDGNYGLEAINNNFPAENDIFSSEVITAMSNKHWYSYGLVGSLMKLILIALELFFFYTISDYLPTDAKFSVDSGARGIICLVIFYIIVFLEIRTEILEVKSSGLRRYLRSDQNFIDMVALMTYVVMVIFYTMQYHFYTFSSYPENFLEIKVIVLAFFYFIVALRMLWMFQIFPNFGFYLRMITYTIKSIFLFYWIFLLVIVIICWSLAGLKGDGYLTQQLSWNAGNFFRIYKAAFGDVDDFFGIIDENLMRYGFMYFLYYVISIILTVILLNILITLLGDAYGTLKEYQDQFNQKTIVSCTMAVIGNGKLKKFESKVHYKWHESCIFYVKFFFYAYFREIVLVRERFGGNYFVYSYLAGRNGKEYQKDRDYFLNENITETYN